MSILYQRSMDEKCVPEDWKKADVVPIYKGGSKFSAANYRPVNLTLTIMKVMESIVKDEMMGHLERNKLIKGTQHGFRPGMSMVTNLIEFWSQVID